MNKIASYLQQHISGEVLTGKSVLNSFSTDASILEMKPHMVVHPRSTNDIRKIARFSWQLAEKGHILPLTARGSGTDQTGAAIGSGIVMSFPAHMNRILEIDVKQRLVRVQPGLNFKALQDTLQTHGLFLPAYPVSYAYSTVGGAIANNAGGEKSYKYGVMRDWVEQLEVVLANGEVIETGRISRKEVERRKGLPTLEGEIYRVVDGVLSDYQEQIEATAQLNIAKNNAGYALADIKRKDGSIDLTPLFVGSQGTLGVVSEAILRVAPYSPDAHVVFVACDSIEAALDVAEVADKLAPSALEMIDRQALEFVQEQQESAILAPFFGEETTTPEAVVLIEFDDDNHRARVKKTKKLEKQLNGIGQRCVMSDDYDQRQKMWAIRYSTSAILNYEHNGKMAVPVLEDAVVPPVALNQFVAGVREMFTRHHLEAMIWGHLGEASLRVVPLLDLRKLTDRQKAFKLLQAYVELVTRLGGSVSANTNDGRLKVPFVVQQYGEDMAAAYREVRRVCDAHATLNPGVKVDGDVKELANLMRKEYSLSGLDAFLPRS